MSKLLDDDINFKTTIGKLYYYHVTDFNTTKIITEKITIKFIDKY